MDQGTQTAVAAPARTRDGPAGALPDHFSHSSMSAFQDCPRKWRYWYLSKCPKEFVSSSLLLGKAVHAALEEIHLVHLGGKAQPLEAGFLAFERSWEEEAGAQEVRFNGGEDRAQAHGLARRMIRLYVEEHLPRLGRILAIEEEVRVEIAGMAVPAVGRIDTLVEEDGALGVVDAKTSRSALAGDKLVQASAQLALYASALAPLAGRLGRPVRGRFQVFRKLRAPRIETIPVDLPAADLARSRRTLQETWNLIAAAHAAGSFPRRASWVCRQCPFQKRCEDEAAAGQ